MSEAKQPSAARRGKYVRKKGKLGALSFLFSEPIKNNTFKKRTTTRQIKRHLLLGVYLQCFTTMTGSSLIFMLTDFLQDLRFTKKNSRNYEILEFKKIVVLEKPFFL